MLHWILVAAIVLAASLIFELTFLAYAMEALLLLLVGSRLLARWWIESLSAQRETSQVVADVGDTVSVVIRVRNRGLLPIPWCLVEDLLPRAAVPVPVSMSVWMSVSARARSEPGSGRGRPPASRR